VLYQYLKLALRLSGQTSIISGIFFVFKSRLGIEEQKKLQKFAISSCPESFGDMLEYR